MDKGIFIIGTGTDIGKTYVTALIVKALRERGVNAGYFKAALSGAKMVDGKMVEGDAKVVCDVADFCCFPESLVPYIFETPVSPHLASKIEKNPILMDEIASRFREICQEYAFLVVEGSGGIVCPLRYDDQVLMLTDVMKMTGFPLLLVADAGLGTINDTVLTVVYAKSHGFSVKGIVMNQYEAQNEMHKDNKKMIEAFTCIPVVTCLGVDEDKVDVDFLKDIIACW